MAVNLMRLDKFISGLTGMSRKDVKAALSRGRVSVDGKPARDPASQVDERSACVTLDGRALIFRKHRHIMLNKPAGVLTATEDKRQRTVMDILPEELLARDLTPIGRLDKDTTGLLLLTTDGQLAHRLISPRHHVEKEYLARVDGELDASDIEAFAQGMQLSDFTAMPAQLQIVEPSLARVVLQEGKYHQVKRMLASRGKPVLELERVRMGAIELDRSLSRGDARALSDGEIAELYRSAGLEDEDNSGGA